MNDWIQYRKIQLEENPNIDQRKLADFWFEVRQGLRKTSYRINYRKGHLHIRKTLQGEFKSWKDAYNAGDKIIANAKIDSKPKDPNLVRCEDISKKIINIIESKSEAYHEQARYFYDCLIVPWLNANCPYACKLNANTWESYKAYRFKENARAPIRHDRYYMNKIYAYAFEEGIIDRKPVLSYDPEKEDHTAEGLVIPPHDFEKILFVANSVSSKWRDRIVMQRYTGMRPGEVRCLQKDRVTYLNDACVKINLLKEDTKNRKARSFLVTSLMVIEVLKKRTPGSSTYYFPARGGDGSRPITRDLSGWESILKKAKIDERYTPHDLRHTYLTEMFKNNPRHAVICYQAGLSIEVANEVYLHYKAEDTFDVAEHASVIFSKASLQ